jgi:hypothetical protein
MVGAIALLVASLHFLWQYALTGDPLQNPYLLWWSYDKIGFGEGFGIAEGGHSLYRGWLHTKNSLRIAWQDLWGWGRYSWLLLLPGLWAVRHRPRLWLIASVFPSLVGVYLFYWVSGPRYFFEGLYGLTILSAAGIAWLAGWMPGQKVSSASRNIRIRQVVIIMGFIGLLVFRTLPYTPARLHEIKDLYGFSRADLEPFLAPAAQELAPALIIVQAADWWDYGVYLHLEDPRFTTPFIFAWSSPSKDLVSQMAQIVEDRTIYYYYPDDPGEFYVLPRP